MKVVTNRCYGGFSLSHEAVMLYAKKKGFTLYHTPLKGEDNLFTNYSRKSFTKNPSPNYTVIDRWETPDEAYFSPREIERTDPDLIAVVEELKNQANGSYAKLEVTTIPDGVDYEIDEHDGLESIHETHRSW